MIILQVQERVLVKSPRVFDVSFYNEVIDWRKALGEGLVDAAIVKASEGLFNEDSQFRNNWPALANYGIPRGCYHFYRWYSGTPAWQAKHFVNVIRKWGGFMARDVLVLDEEESGHMSITSMLDWTYNVEQLTGISHTQMLWYSNAYLLNALNFRKLRASQVEYIREIPTWVAGYPRNPDQYADPTQAGYRVDLNRFGRSVLWQYASAAQIPGIPGDTDANWCDNDYLRRWKGF
jgi:GH25 family lysozyme M1 (1,4-beta-N-acetylmuramidase)